MSLSEIAAITGGELVGCDARVCGLSTDTRTLDAGALFAAVTGPSFDGNDFLDEAASRGAAGALCSRIGDALPCVRVADTVSALHRLVANWRQRFSVATVAVTGSNGKTTVKEMIAHIAARAGSVLATQGNLNNHIGVPLTLARLDASHQRLVIELGANHPGEIAALAALAQPQVGVITIIAPAHLEGFGSIEGVARAKGELIEALPVDGTAVVNGDGEFQWLWRDLAGDRRLIRFGLNADVEVGARYRACAQGSRVTLATPNGELTFLLALPGRHNVANAAAAAAAALALGVGTDAIAAGLEDVRPVSGRLMPLAGRGGVHILDDTYNANLGSLDAALEVLAASAGPHWVVLGDMAELGDDAERFHRDAGERVRAAGVEHLWCAGALSRHAAQAYGAGARHFEHADALLADLALELDAPATVLVKGSRSAGMERVVAALVAGDAREAEQCF